MSWLRRNAESIEAIAASITACVAIAAFSGVFLQLQEADRIQKSTAAREAYRGHLALATTQPAFAAPADSCTTLNSDQGGAYAAFVDHLVYSADLTLAVDPSWDGIFIENLLPHAGYVCTGWPAGIGGLAGAARCSPLRARYRLRERPITALRAAFTCRSARLLPKGRP